MTIKGYDHPFDPNYINIDYINEVLYKINKQEIGEQFKVSWKSLLVIGLAYFKYVINLIKTYKWYIKYKKN